ncbi:MAG: hypothetical protein HQL51_04790 [Magnetococcales bacterium]|nr:hypothetical protein [Magnetococcales bacterium]
MEEKQLREKLRKIEALFAGTGVAGERLAAQAALERIRAKLAAMGRREAPVELRLSLHDPWSRQLFTALCRRYGIEPYRYRRQHRTTIMFKTPRRFVDETLLPEFKELNAALVGYLAGVTQRIIREEIHRETGEAQERDEPECLP